MNQSTKNAFVQLHVAVFIFGFTAILGKMITQDHFTIVWHRMWIAAFGFLLFPQFIKTLFKTSLKHFVYLLGIGCLVAIHWITFYGSIKIGDSASLTLGCFGLTSTFTSILEPLIYPKKFEDPKPPLRVCAPTLSIDQFLDFYSSKAEILWCV